MEVVVCYLSDSKI